MQRHFINPLYFLY